VQVGDRAVAPDWKELVAQQDDGAVVFFTDEYIGGKNLVVNPPVVDMNDPNQALSDDNLLHFLGLLRKKWLIDDLLIAIGQQEVKWETNCSFQLALLKYAGSDLSPRDQFEQYNTEISNLFRMFVLRDNRATREGRSLLLNSVVPGILVPCTYKEVFERITFVAYFSYMVFSQGAFMMNTLTSMHWSPSCLNDTERLFANTLVQYIIPTEERQKEASKKSQLFSYILENLMRDQYGYIGNHCYEPRKVNGFFTYSWKPKAPLADYVNSIVSRERNFEMWNIKLSVQIEDIVKKLTDMNDPSFPRLVKNRYVFAFKNGLYFSHWQKAMNGPIRDADFSFSDRFFPYHMLPPLPRDLAASKYFDINFHPLLVDGQNAVPEDWFDIPTPHFQSILDFQFHEEEEYEDICRMMYRMVGRLLYKAGDMDNWQVWPFLKGRAATGKSTIITKVCKEFYETDRVGILSSTSEGVFALSAFAFKDLVIAPELTGTCNISQAALQGMISAEELSIARKNEVALMEKFQVPGIMAGNENPGGQAGMADKAGSLARRLLIFLYSKRVPKNMSDPKLPQKLQSELGNLLLKCNRAYLEFVHLNGDKDIWRIVPTYFLETQKDFSKDSNMIVAFLSSNRITFDPAQYCPLSKFQSEFRDFCISNGMSRQNIQFTNESLVAALADLSFDKNIRLHLDKARSRKTWPLHSTNTIEDCYIEGLNIVQLVGPNGLL
jgi:hypothetical protein